MMFEAPRLALRPLWHASLVLAVFLCPTIIAVAQDQPAPPPAAPSQAPPAPVPAAPETPAAAAEPSQAPAPRIRFNFKGATFPQVLDFFSRATGLSVIYETPAPEGTLDYLSPEEYALPDALRVLNIILQARGVMLRVSEDMLYLQKLTEMRREDVPTYVGSVPAEVTSEQIVTVVFPLNIALAKPLAERLANLIAEYGSVTAIETQNALVLTETAGKVRQLISIIEELDRQDPEGVIEIYALKHTKASEVMASLKALLSEKVVKFVINQQGQQVQIEENALPGLSISGDDRTNSIIAKGQQARMNKLREAVALLDVPTSSTSTGRAMRTIPLNKLLPNDAVAKLRDLYAKLAEDKRPAVIAMDDAATVTIVGSETAVNEGLALLREIDGEAAPSPDAAHAVAVVPIASADARSLVATLTAMLNRRQAASLKVLVGPDGASVVIAGHATEVEAAKALAAALDQPSTEDFQLRVVAVANTADPEALIERAGAFFTQSTQNLPDAAKLDLPRIDLDRASASILLAGRAAAVSRLAAIIEQLAAAQGPAPEFRLVPLEHVNAAEAAAFVRNLAQSQLGSAANLAPPVLTPIDRTNAVLVAARPGQAAIIELILKNYDVPAGSTMPPLRILQLRAADAANLAELLNKQFAARPAADQAVRPVTITADVQTNALLVAAHTDLLPEIQAVVDELNKTDRLDRAGREIRIFPLKVARAEDLARTIDEMYPPPPPPVDARGRVRPDLQPAREVVVRSDAQTNALIVDAPIARMAGFEKLVEQLDRQQLTADVEVRTFRILHADLQAIANALRGLAEAGSLSPSGSDRRAPITISAEPLTNTLIVAGPREVFERIDQVLRELDARPAAPATTLRLYRLSHAKAETLAPMLQNILAARISETIPEAATRIQTFLNISADRKTNTLIISAPESLLPIAEELIKQLDDATASTTDPVIRVKPLNFADARDVSASITTALGAMINAATGEPMTVRLIASAASNALILVGPADELAEVEKLIEPLDARPALDAIDAKTLRLAHASAAVIAPIVQRLLTDQQETDPRIILERMRQSRGQLDLTPRIRVEADERTNSLIVSGPQRTVALAEALLIELDKPDDTAQRAYQTFTPRNAEPDALAASVKQVIDATRPPSNRATLTLFAEKQTRAIIAIGSPEETEQAVALLKQWDETAVTPPAMDLRILTLKSSDPAVVAAALTPMLRDPARWPASLRAAAASGLTLAQPSVTADPSAHRVLINAPSELMPLAESLIAQLDQPRTSDSAIDIKIFNLTQAKAADVAPAIRASLETRAAAAPAPAPKFTVNPEPSSNSVIVSAPAEFIAVAEAMIAKLDLGLSADQPQVRTIFLKTARAESVAPIVEKLLTRESLVTIDMIPMWARAEYARSVDEQTASTPRVRVVADERLNAIVLAAPPALLNVAEQMIAQLDVPAADLADASARSIRVLTIDNASAADLAANLESLLKDQNPAEPAPVIRVDAASNSLIIRATNAQFALIEQIVAKIDSASITASRQMRTVPIDASKASAAEVAEALRRLLDRGGGSSSVEVISLEELLQRHTTPEAETPAPAPGPGASLPLPLALAVLALALPQDSAPDARAAAPASGALPDESDAGRVTIAVDPTTNSLILLGPSRAIDRAMALAIEIQSQIPALPSRIRAITLPSTIDSAALAQSINAALQRIAPPGGQTGDLARRVAVIADDASSALIVAASDTDFPTIAQLIAALSRPGRSDELIVKVYPLSTVTASRAADRIRQLVAADSPIRPRGRQEQRMRELAVTLLMHGQSIEAAFDPTRVRVSADAPSNSIMVIAPVPAIAFIDRYVELIDQAPVEIQTTLKLYPLQAARARDLTATLRGIFQARARAAAQSAGTPELQPEFAADDRTNTLLVTASPEHLVEIDRLLTQLDQKLADEQLPLRLLQLTTAQPSTAAELLLRVVVGSDQQRRASTLIIPNDPSGSLLIRATEAVNAEIDRVLAEVDRASTNEFPVRTVLVERADAAAVAAAVQRFYDDRARIASEGRGRRAQARRISIIGDTNSRTLLVAANDNDFEEISRLITQFDSPQATRNLAFRVFPLQHAKAGEIERTVNGLIEDLTWNQGPMFFFWGMPASNQNQNRDRLAVRADTRLNALIATGSGDKFDVVEQLIAVLDAPPPAGEQRIVRLYAVRHADLTIVAEVLRESFTDVQSGRRWWEPPDKTQALIREDARSKTIVVSASAKQQEDIARLITSLDSEVAPAQQQTQVLGVQFARATELAETLTRFLRDQAAAVNAPRPTATIIASDSANTLVVSASEAEMLTIRDLLTKLDQADVSGERVVDILPVRAGNAADIARIVQAQFERRGGQGVIITPDVRTGSVIVNAPREQFAQASALIQRLDAPRAADETIIRTYSLAGARADEAMRILRETLQLDARGETRGITIRTADDQPAVEVKARVAADRRSNTLIVTATAESFTVIESLINRLDAVKPVSAVDYRIVALNHAVAGDVAAMLRQVAAARGPGGEDPPRIDYDRVENELIIAATPDQFEQLSRIISEIDQPATKTRKTDFVPLQHAQAEKVQEALSMFYGPLAAEADTPGKRNVRIVADPATNSLVISAEDGEWEGVRALLAKLDGPEYDSSLQLRVIPLLYADARSVTRAVNEAFARPPDQSNLNNRGNQGGPRFDLFGFDPRAFGGTTSVLVKSEEWVRASAEPQTNSLIVSANNQNLRKIEEIVKLLDVADFAKLPKPQIIPVSTGNPVQLAEAINRVYDRDGRGGAGSSDDVSRRALRIVGDPISNVLIVRAEDADFQQIRALAEALQQQASAAGLTVNVLKLNAAPAARVSTAITAAYRSKAEKAGQPFSIQIEPQSNSLIIASTASLFEEIKATVAQLDALAPAAGQGIFIIELEHVAPDAAKSIIETIGLDKPQPADSVSRLVTEPVKVSALPGRNAIVVVANPVDQTTLISLVKAIDKEPGLAESHVQLIRLKNAEAEALARILSEILKPGEQQTQTPLARAIREQVRRLSVRGESAQLSLDLTKPIRIIPDASLNAILVSSTRENVAALEGLARLFDQLPITGAVTVQLFPLQNIAAADFARILRELFQQGKNLAQIPGTEITGIPEGVAGKALLDSVAITTDERTNTVIVAGKEDAVALADVLAKRIDSDTSTGWVEPRLIAMRHADATDLAATLQAILVEGASNLPQSGPLQRQLGRLRMARMAEDGGAVLQSNVFQPLTRMVIRAESQLNALILVGTPANIEVVSELIKMLDVPAASPSAVVRVYPVEHASASRLAGTITRLFDQQIESKAIRPEDKVIIQPDERTNALVVTTSPRSFAVFERLLETLDREIAPDLREIRQLALKNASAARLGPLIQQLMDSRMERLRKVQPEAADLERATILAEPRTNSLLVAAGNDSFDVVRRLVSDLDTSTLAESSLVEVIPVERGNIDRLAQTITTIMDRRYADMPAELRNALRPIISTDSRTNSLLVTATVEDLAAIRDLVIKLEAAPTNQAVAIHVLTLDDLRADSLAPRLDRLMRERQQSLGAAATPTDRVTIEADPASNSLIVAASEENLQILRDFIDMLKRTEGAGSGSIDVIQLASSRAEDIVDMLNDLYVAEANRTRGPNAVRVTADPRLNAVLVSAPAGDVDALKRLVLQLDGAKPASVVEIKYIPLTGANALETVNLIENILSGRTLGNRRAGAQATVVRYLREIQRNQNGSVDDAAPPDEHAEMEVSAAIRESISLTPDLRTNTVIIKAPRESMAMLEQMIRDLDSSSIGAQNIRIFKLANADAQAMAQVLTQLFSLERRGSLYVLKPREGSFDAPPPPAGDMAPAPPAPSPFASLSGTDLTAVPDERQQLAITIDSRTNSLLVSGSPNYLDLVERVVNELDAQEANEREVLVYQLRNATAEEVARVVGAFVEQEQRKLVSTLGSDQIGSATRLLEREITIQGDSKSNTVLVSASPRYMATVKQMITKLDVDPPQVLIQVLLAEVTIDSREDWGVDMEFRADIDGVDVIGGYGLAGAFVPGIGVPNIAISASDFDLLIYAMKSQGRLQVLSNPSVMAANNEKARIQVGETIRLPTSTSISDAGRVASTIEKEEIGIILNVTPSINPDGFVRMAISPEISNLSARTTQISEDFESPIITRRTADTTVTVYDGQTVIIGGLISDRFEKRDRKVPFFGDLPLVGALFRSEVQETAKTELLIVLTPYVIESPAEVGRMRDLTNIEIDRLSLPEEVKENIRRSIREGTGGLYNAEGRRLDQSTIPESTQTLPNEPRP